MRSAATSFGMSACPFNRRKPFDSFDDAGRDPAHDHLPSAPPFHVPLHVTGATDNALDRVRRGERVPKALGDAESQHRHRVVEAFPHTGGGAWIPVGESPSEILQQPPRDRHVGLSIRARHRGLGAGRCPSGRCSKTLRSLCAWHRWIRAAGPKVCVRGFVQGFGPIEDHQETAIRP